MVKDEEKNKRKDITVAIFQHFLPNYNH